MPNENPWDFNLLRWNNKIIAGYFPFREVYDDYKFGRPMSHSILRSNDKILYTLAYSDKIFEIKTNEISAKYYFDFNKYKIPTNYFNNINPELRLKKLLDNDYYAYLLGYFYETKRHFASAFILKKELNYFFYSKKTGHYKYGNCNKINYILGSLIPLTTSDENFIGLLDVQTIQTLQTSIWQKKLSKKNKEFIEQFKNKIDINPVLVIFQLKDF